MQGYRIGVNQRLLGRRYRSLCSSGGSIARCFNSQPPSWGDIVSALKLHIRRDTWGQLLQAHCCLSAPRGFPQPLSAKTSSVPMSALRDASTTSCQAGGMMNQLSNSTLVRTQGQILWQCAGTYCEAHLNLSGVPVLALRDASTVRNQNCISSQTPQPPERVPFARNLARESRRQQSGKHALKTGTLLKGTIT
jgi:hypothetical protein